jgi:tight adherence protein B
MMVPAIAFIMISIVVVNAAAMMSAKRRRAELARRLDMGGGETGTRPATAPKPKDGFMFAKLDAAMRGMSISDHIKRELKRANWSMKVSEFIAFTVLSASLPPLLALVATHKKPLAVALIALGAVFPFIVLKRRQAARRKQFAEQILDAVMLISNSLKSGYSFQQAVDVVAREMAPPISEEFKKLLQELKLGVQFDTAMKNLVERVGNDDIDLVATCVNIQREIGGNLSEILDNISHTIRDRVRIKGEVRTLTAQGRLSGWILSLLPIGIGMLIYVINPAYISVLFTNRIGQAMLLVCAINLCIGMTLIKKIVNIKV